MWSNHFDHSLFLSIYLIFNLYRPLLYERPDPTHTVTHIHTWKLPTRPVGALLKGTSVVVMWGKVTLVFTFLTQIYPASLVQGSNSSSPTFSLL